MRRTSAKTSNVAPRVSFTGRKINYKKEFALAFGDYCECYDPKVISNDAEQKRTEPCIALYPTANANGSWIFLNLVITRMNELAGVLAAEALFADEAIARGEQRPPPRRPAGHMVNPRIVTPVTHPEAERELDEPAVKQEVKENVPQEELVQSAPVVPHMPIATDNPLREDIGLFI